MLRKGSCFEWFDFIFSSLDIVQRVVKSTRRCACVWLGVPETARPLLAFSYTGEGLLHLFIFFQCGCSAAAGSKRCTALFRRVQHPSWRGHHQCKTTVCVLSSHRFWKSICSYVDVTTGVTQGEVITGFCFSPLPPAVSAFGLRNTFWKKRKNNTPYMLEKSFVGLNLVYCRRQLPLSSIKFIGRTYLLGHEKLAKNLPFFFSNAGSVSRDSSNPSFLLPFYGSGRPSCALKVLRSLLYPLSSSSPLAGIQNRTNKSSAVRSGKN